MRFLCPALAVVLSLPAWAQSEAPPAAAADATAADYQRVDERSPRDGTPLIANKLYPMAGRFEFNGSFDISYANKYTDYVGGHAGVGFHLFDWLAFEGFGGYWVPGYTGIYNEVQNAGKSNILASTGADCANPTCEPQLPDTVMQTWFAGANVQWAPIYGKISAVSEYDLNFQFYGRLGGGVEGIQRLLRDNVTVTDLGVRPSLNYGLGVRLIPWEFVAIRAELMNYAGINPNVEEHDDTDESSCAEGYVLGAGNNKSCLTDFSNISVLQIGVSFLL